MVGQSDDNLLFALHRWAWRQDENFTSEAFAHLLSQLLAEAQPTAGVAMLSFLTDGRLVVPHGKAERVDVSTQVTTDQGRPDIEIRTPEHLVYVEVKMGAGVNCDQLKGYWTALTKTDCPNKTLVLLTRYPVESSDAVPGAVVPRRWYEVADKLMELRNTVPPRNGEALSLLDQFVDFLRLRGATMERVGWEYGPGIRAFLNLMSMTGEAITACGETASMRTAQEWAGFKIGDGYCWLRLAWERPSNVSICANSDISISEQKIETLGYGTYGQDPLWGGTRWWHETDLESEDAHFFSRTRASQRQYIEDFVRKGIEGARTLAGKEDNGG